MAYRGMPNPALFELAVRNGVTTWYTVDAALGGVPVAGATGMQPPDSGGGSVADTGAPGVRRLLNLELPGDTALYDRLKPIGTLLTVTCHVQLANHTVIDIPMGVFDIDDGSVPEAGAGSLKIVAPDKWQKIVRAKFIVPQASNAGVTIIEQIIELIRGALGSTEPVVVTATSVEMMGTATWATDRAQTILDLAKSIGAWVYFDRDGVATIADIPQVGYLPDWTIDGVPGGVAVSIDHQVSRTSTFNVVSVSSSSATGDQAFDTQYAWDSDPASPTYAGPDPINHPELAGPFGVSTYEFSSSNINNAAQAAQTAYAILATTIGLASQVTATAVPNPAIDAFDVIDVLPPGRGAVASRHMVDVVTHSLDVTQPQHITGRSTRTDSYT